MAIDFPDSPSNNDIYTVNGKRWIYSSGKWSIYGSTAPDATASDTEPTGVGDGHIWYRSDQSQTLIRYDNTWVEVGSAGGFDNASTNFPTSLDSATGFAAVEALQAKVGADSSAVATSLDYKVSDHASRLTTLESDVAGLVTGKILQVVSTFFQGDFSTSSLSFVDATGHSVTITPSSSSSNILVFYDAYIFHSTGGGTREINLVRDSTTINQPSSGVNPASAQTYHAAYENGRTGFHHLDSPATTSAVTYKIQIKTDRGTVRLGTDASGGVLRTPTNFTVMEVAT